MTNKPIQLLFPLKGIDRNFAVSSQPALTSPRMLNVRPYDVLENRARGGQRPGLNKAYSQQLGTGKPVVAMCTITIVT